MPMSILKTLKTRKTSKAPETHDVIDPSGITPLRVAMLLACLLMLVVAVIN